VRTIQVNNGGTFIVPEKGESGNPNGRPKKSFTLFNQELVRQGYQPLTKRALVEAYSLLFSVDQQKIEELAEDILQPLAIRQMIAEMTDPASRARMMQTMIETMFGKADQNNKVTVKVGTDLEDETYS
jgi:ATP-dependent protease Clp ATPase subunit